MRIGEGEESKTLTENIYLMATLRSLQVHSQMMNMWSSLMDKQCQVQGFEKGGHENEHRVLMCNGEI